MTPDREPVEQAVDAIIDSLDIIVRMAVTPAKYDEVAKEEEALWAIKGRAEWLLSYIKEKQQAPAHIRIVK